MLMFGTNLKKKETIIITVLSPEMANPEKPTARTRKVMATPLV